VGEGAMRTRMGEAGEAMGSVMSQDSC